MSCGSRVARSRASLDEHGRHPRHRQAEDVAEVVPGVSQKRHRIGEDAIDDFRGDERHVERRTDGKSGSKAVGRMAVTVAVAAVLMVAIRVVMCVIDRDRNAQVLRLAILSALSLRYTVLVMSLRVRKLISLALAGWFLVVASGYAAAFNVEAQHDAAWSHEDASGKTPDGVDHGCMGHLSAHVVAIEQASQLAFTEPRASSLPCHPDAPAIRWQTEPVSPPPNALA